MKRGTQHCSRIQTLDVSDTALDWGGGREGLEMDGGYQSFQFLAQCSVNYDH